jgi:hypothetical protein
VNEDEAAVVELLDRRKEMVLSEILLLVIALGVWLHAIAFITRR